MMVSASDKRESHGIQDICIESFFLGKWTQPVSLPWIPAPQFCMPPVLRSHTKFQHSLSSRTAKTKKPQDALPLRSADATRLHDSLPLRTRSQRKNSEINLNDFSEGPGAKRVQRNITKPKVTKLKIKRLKIQTKVVNRRSVGGDVCSSAETSQDAHGTKQQAGRRTPVVMIKKIKGQLLGARGHHAVGKHTKQSSLEVQQQEQMTVVVPAGNRSFQATRQATGKPGEEYASQNSLKQQRQQMQFRKGLTDATNIKGGKTSLDENSSRNCDVSYNLRKRFAYRKSSQSVSQTSDNDGSDSNDDSWLVNKKTKQGRKVKEERGRRKEGLQRKISLTAGQQEAQADHHSKNSAAKICVGSKLGTAAKEEGGKRKEGLRRKRGLTGGQQEADVGHHDRNSVAKSCMGSKVGAAGSGKKETTAVKRKKNNTTDTEPLNMKPEGSHVTARAGTLQHLRQKQCQTRVQLAELSAADDIFADGALLPTRSTKLSALCQVPCGDLTVVTPNSKGSGQGVAASVTPRTTLLGQFGGPVTPTTPFVATAVSPCWLNSPTTAVREAQQVMFHLMQGKKGKPGNRRKIVKCAGDVSTLGTLTDPNFTPVKLPSLLKTPDGISADESFDEYFSEDEK